MSKLTQTLDFRQQQNLVMTPQMQQAIKLLQLSNLELQDFLEGEIAHNPLLERDEGAEKASEAEETSPQSPSEETDNIAESFGESWQDQERPEPASAPQDFDGGSSMSGLGSGGRMDFSDDELSFENTLSKPKSLRDHLLEQLAIECDTPSDRAIGALLIDRLDEAGYLRDDLTSLAAQMGCPAPRLSALLERLKTFDPAGIFARDLAECLALQLEDRGQLDAPMKALTQHLPLVAERNFKKLASLCGVEENEIPGMIETIRTLNPKPSAPFDHVVVQTAIPDVLMKRLPKEVGGGWRVELNSETLPRVLVNNEYYAEVSKHAKDKTEKEYLTTQMANASWLVKALDQRAQTILKVASEIVEMQDGFFLYGIEFLKPLTLREIAEKIGMHESTVSRVTTGKFIGTPRGLFELKFFFTSSIGGTDGSAISSESVKARIKALIDAEDPNKILSDDDLADLLKKEGMDVARRTVAKYREALNIQSSVQRRRMKKTGK
jgi:RNA polymerase sigma-54 factor